MKRSLAQIGRIAQGLKGGTAGVGGEFRSGFDRGPGFRGLGSCWRGVVVFWASGRELPSPNAVPGEDVVKQPRLEDMRIDPDGHPKDQVAACKEFLL